MDNRKIKTNDVIEFLFKAEINWVIIKKNGSPLCWPDGNVKVYSNVTDLMADYDKKAGQSIMTEYAFVMSVMGENKLAGDDAFCNFEQYKASLS